MRLKSKIHQKIIDEIKIKSHRILNVVMTRSRAKPKLENSALSSEIEEETGGDLSNVASAPAITQPLQDEIHSEENGGNSKADNRDPLPILIILKKFQNYQAI